MENKSNNQGTYKMKAIETEVPLKLEAILLSPTVGEAKNLTKEDVWGVYEDGEVKSTGMVVAKSGSICPVWKDTVPYKSVTVICKEDQVNEVVYWLEYCHGGGSVSNQQVLENGKVALRSNYLCW